MAVNFCLPPDAVNKFKNALVSGKIDPEKLTSMTSEERRAFFEDITGKENAKGVNTLFESKLLLKNKQQGYITWAKKVAGMNPEVRRDLLARIQRMDERVLDPEAEQGFLKDLAEHKLGIGVSQDEAKNIATMSKSVQDLEAKARPDGTFPSKQDRTAYGLSKVHLENYVNDLKIKAKNMPTKNPVKLAGRGAKATPGFLTSSLATADNSFFGRQGIKALLNVRDADIWIKGQLKSWRNIERELTRHGSQDSALDLVKADIYSRPNALNGNYRRLGKESGLEALTEEAYPSHAPEKIPLFGRLFKAAEAAYNGGALQMRADLADRFIKVAEKQGINTKSSEEMKGIGSLVGSMTGRGHLHDIPSTTSRYWLFAPKFLKANVNTLTLHAFDKSATAFTRKEAAKNLAGIITSVSAVLTVAHALDPKSVELDPRSTHFGKIKVFGHWTDITGGMGSMLTLAARLVPTYNKGSNERFLGMGPSGVGFYSKSNSGNVNDLNSNKFGAQTGEDVFTNFWTGKTAPVPSTVLQIWKGQDYNQQKPTAKSIAGNTLVPISIQNIGQLNDKSNADRLGSLIADGLGFSVSTNPTTNKNNLPGASKNLVDALNNAQYNISKPGTTQRNVTLNHKQYQQFVSDRDNRFTQAVQKALSSNQQLDKNRLNTTMTKATAQSLNDLHISKPKRAKSAKAY